MSLEQKTQLQPADRVYEEFEPPYDWVHEEASGTIILMLPGFKKEQLRVQIASTRILRLSGERQIHENKWRQFRKEFPIPPEFDTSGISAKFEGGMLYVKIPKLITPIKTQPPPTTQLEAPKPPQQPTPNAQPDQQKPRIVDKVSQAKAEKTTQPPLPTPIAPPQKPKADEDSQKKARLVDKAAETKAEKTEAPLQVPKAVYDSQKEKGKSEATTSKTQGMHETTSPDGLGKGEAKMEKRSQTLELLSRQTQEYKNAFSRLVEELKKQKKLVNLLVAIFLVLAFVLYVKNAIKSSFEAPKSQEL